MNFNWGGFPDASLIHELWLADDRRLIITSSQPRGPAAVTGGQNGVAQPKCWNRTQECGGLFVVQSAVHLSWALSHKDAKGIGWCFLQGQMLNSLCSINNECTRNLKCNFIMDKKSYVKLSRFIGQIQPRVCVCVCMCGGVCVILPEKSRSIVTASSLQLLPLRVSIRVLNRVPMGSRGWPTQPSRLVTDVTPLFSSSALKDRHKS